MEVSQRNQGNLLYIIQPGGPFEAMLFYRQGGSSLRRSRLKIILLYLRHNSVFTQNLELTHQRGSVIRSPAVCFGQVLISFKQAVQHIKARYHALVGTPTRAFMWLSFFYLSPKQTISWNKHHSVSHTIVNYCMEVIFLLSLEIRRNNTTIRIHDEYVDNTPESTISRLSFIVTNHYKQQCRSQYETGSIPSSSVE